MTHSSSTFITLTGGKGSGKDTLAAVLIERGFVNLKFAGALKAMIAELLRYQGADEVTIDRMIEGDLKEVPSELLAGKTPRWAMQSLGTEWGRELIGEDLWVDAAMKKAATLDKVVMTDVRFHNECGAVKTNGGVVIRINQAGAGAPVDLHQSEAEIGQLPVDAEFLNDKRLGIELARSEFEDLLAIWLNGG